MTCATADDAMMMIEKTMMMMMEKVVLAREMMKALTQSRMRLPKDAGRGQTQRCAILLRVAFCQRQ